MMFTDAQLSLIKKNWLTFKKNEFVLFIGTWSQRGHSVSFTTTFFFYAAHYQIGHQAKSKMGCQPGNCNGHLSSPGDCVCMYDFKKNPAKMGYNR